MSYVSEVLADSPVAYWRMGESDVGATLVDEQAAHDGTYVDGPSLVAGLIGASDDARQLNGTSQFATVPWHADLNTTEWTGELWVETAAWDGNDRILSNRTSGGGWEIWCSSSGGTITAMNISGGSQSGRTDHNVTAAEPHHVVATFDGTTVRLYIDGVEEDTAAGSLTLNPSADLNIGNLPFASRLFGGILDEIAVYDYALSAARVAAHYDARDDAGTGVTVDTEAARVVLRAATTTVDAGGNTISTDAARVVLRAAETTVDAGGATVGTEAARLVLRAGATTLTLGQTTVSTEAGRIVLRAAETQVEVGATTIDTDAARLILRAAVTSVDGGSVVVLQPIECTLVGPAAECGTVTPTATCSTVGPSATCTMST